MNTREKQVSVCVCVQKKKKKEKLKSCNTSLTTSVVQRQVQPSSCSSDYFFVVARRRLSRRCPTLGDRNTPEKKTPQNNVLNQPLNVPICYYADEI